MSLTWNVEKVADFENVCRVGEGNLNPITNVQRYERAAAKNSEATMAAAK